MSGAPHLFQSVSVVLCSHNGGAFLQQQLESIAQQTCCPFELVVVDDASTDDSWPLLEQFAAGNAWVRLYRNEQALGFNKNFERALTLATGAIIAIADQDDIWHPEKIERQLRHWTDDTLLIYHDSVFFSGTIPPAPQPGRLMNRVWGTDPRRLAVYNTVSGHAIMLRRQLLELALPFAPDVYYDWWLAIVAMCNGGLSYCPEILVYQRRHQHNSSLPHGLTREAALDRERRMVLRNLGRFAEAPNMPAQHRSFFVQLHTLWQQAAGGRQGWALFTFLMRHRGVIYCSKKRKLALPSQVKRSFRYAFGK